MNTNHDWLNLIEVSGPFLAVPVLRDVFPQGLEGLDVAGSARLRRAYEEWRDAVEAEDELLPALHDAWLREVFNTALEMDAHILKTSNAIPAALQTSLPEYGVTLVPDHALVDTPRNDAPLLLVHVFEPDANLDAARDFGGWIATPAERMVTLLRSVGCAIGLVTNGERWMLIHAPSDRIASFASWYARLWGQERETLRAFASLLGASRAFGLEAEKLPTLFERSLAYQDDVTDALGEQVRRAVEVLVQALDRADQDRNRKLLTGIAERELYEAALTVMMRLVFLLAAEERGLLLSGDARYDAHYAISTLRVQLRLETEEILERRRSAWSRLLALFRAVYGGIEHPTLRLPALGGSLFDPDRFPFLEGRAQGTSWHTHPAEPLPIDDRTVLLLLEAIQTFQGRSLSYRALDVEQIGHVYEGLLERTVKRVRDITLELEASATAKEPRVTLGELGSAELDGRDQLIGLLAERSGRTAASIGNALSRTIDSTLAAKLLGVCRGDAHLRDCILPYACLLRTDPWGHPLVHHRDAFVVVLGTERRETGTHYTPKTITEKIVEETLTPLVYRGPADGGPRDEWELKRPNELLDLKICDPAMGSGAFLVQVCRFLAERVVEAWTIQERHGSSIDVDGRAHESDSTGAREALPRDAEARTVIARRLVAERCLYGVDLNPLAVELAKLSLWLTTLAKDRPFGFLDHNLRCGDSLLGIHRMDQLSTLSMDPETTQQPRLFGKVLEHAVVEAIALRLRLRELPIRDIHDVETMAALDAEAREKLQIPELIANAFIGIVFAADNQRTMQVRLDALAINADRVVQGDTRQLDELVIAAERDLAVDAPDERTRQPFHWPLEFPEVFQPERAGFDAFVGNPPFLGGKRITGVAGTAYRDWLLAHVADGRKGSADLVAYFFLRAWTLLRSGGGFGLLAVNTIAEGDTRQVGLEAMVRAGAVVYAAYPNEPWSGKAAVVTSRVHVHKGAWHGERTLLGRPVPVISAFLSDREEWSPKRLRANEGLAFQGSIVLGMGFVLTSVEAERMLNADAKNADVIFPYLNGEDLNTDPEQCPSRWVINFWDWPEERAREYELPWQWIEERVKPERQRRNERGEFVLRKPLPERWWHYADKRPALYHAIGRGQYFERHPDGWIPAVSRQKNVLAITRVSKTLAFSLADANTVFSDATVVLTQNDPSHFSLLQSSVHGVFAWQHASRLKTDLRYAPTDALEPFPWPDLEAHSNLRALGEHLNDARREIMLAADIGLTKLYNRIHAPADSDHRIERLRAIHREIDIAVLHAYGWGDLDLDHGFHEVPYLPEKDNVRFTICEPARVEVLRRLQELNRLRYEEEVAQGLHATRTIQGATRSARVVRFAPATLAQGTLDFEGPATPEQLTSDDVEQRVLSFLQSHPEWHSKSNVVSATRISDGQWNALVSSLIARGLVERQGERRGARYRLLIKQPNQGN